MTVFAAAGSPTGTGEEDAAGEGVGAADDDGAFSGATSPIAVGAGLAVGVTGDGTTACPVAVGAGLADAVGGAGTAAVAGAAARTPATTTTETTKPIAALARVSPEKSDMGILLIRSRCNPALLLVTLDISRARKRAERHFRTTPNSPTPSPRGD
ncbi:hypothetical protein NS283_03870 [Microbacterium testaceum]|nr:hypothetical protein NS283_03870 [Microbacterium testaceum]